MKLRTIAASLLMMLVAAESTSASTAQAIFSVAVFPVENLSGRSAPGDDVRARVIDRLSAAGIVILEDQALDAFMERHRVRYAAGVDAATAALLKQEMKVDAVVVLAIDQFSDLAPPKVGLCARVVSLDNGPTVTWADEASLAGDDAPGLLDLGLVDDYAVLLNRAVERVSESLVSHFTGGLAPRGSKAESKFRPKVTFNGTKFEPGKIHSVAILPFFNLTDRRNAGEILAWLFTRHLSSIHTFRVIDTGEVRQQLLQGRIIMDGGVSLSDAELVASLLDAEFVLAGRVLYYQDYDGAGSNPKVEFSTILIDRKTRRVVWSSHSYNEGTDGVRFFGLGRTATAHTMATQMVRLTTAQMAGGSKRPSAPR